MARIWLERGNSGEPPIWRGHIRHVQSARQRYFEDLSAVSEFLTQITGVSGVPVLKRDDTNDKSTKECN